MKKKEGQTVTVAEKKGELTKFFARLAAGQEKNLKKGKVLKKEIAQMLTRAREKELLKK